MKPHRIILLPGHHLSPSHHTETHHYLTHHLTPMRSCILRPLYACRIFNAAPLPPPKYFLTYYSAALWTLFAAPTAPGASFLPLNLSICQRPPILDAMPPTPPLLPASCQYNLLGTGFLPSQGPSMLPPADGYRPIVALPSDLVSALGNPRVPLPASWTLPLTIPRSLPPKGGLPGPPIDKTWYTLVAPPPPSRAAPPAGSRPFRPSRCYKGPPTSRRLTGRRSFPGT